MVPKGNSTVLFFRLEGNADDVVGGGLGKIDFGEDNFVV
jgi:hypothetical protein